MPLPVLAPLIEGFVVDAAARAGKALLTKLPWATKDAARVGQVEARIRRLAADTTEAARNLSDETMAPHFERLLVQFGKDVAAIGLSPRETEDLVELERHELTAIALAPAQERRQMLKWMQDLEGRVVRIEDTTSKLPALSDQIEALNKRLQTLTIALGVALTLAAVGFLLTVLLLTRK